MNKEANELVMMNSNNEMTARGKGSAEVMRGEW